MNESSQSYIFLKIRFFLTFDRLTRSNRFVYFCNCNLAVSILITRYNTHFTHQTTFWSNTIFILYPHDRSTIIARIHSWRIVQFPPINYHVLACSIITFLADQLHANSSCPVINYYFRSSGLIELEPGWPVSIYPGCVSIYFHYRYLLKYRSGGSTRNASDGIASRSRTWAQGFFLSSVILLNKSSRCPGWRRRLPETSSLLSHLPVDSAPEIMLINTDRSRQKRAAKLALEKFIRTLQRRVILSARCKPLFTITRYRKHQLGVYAVRRIPKITSALHSFVDARADDTRRTREGKMIP